MAGVSLLGGGVDGAGRGSWLHGWLEPGWGRAGAGLGLGRGRAAGAGWVWVDLIKKSIEIACCCWPIQSFSSARFCAASASQVREGFKGVGWGGMRAAK